MPDSYWNFQLVDYVTEEARRRIILEALDRRRLHQLALAEVIQTAGRWHVREAWPRLLKRRLRNRP